MIRPRAFHITLPRCRAAEIAACLVLAGSAPLMAQDSTLAADSALAVAARTIPRGAELVAEDIASASDVSSSVVGWIARRVIREGEALRPPAIVPPPLIRAGEVVRYVVEHSGIRLALTGTALSAASLGETIAVRLDAKRRVQAVVTGPGLVIARDHRRQR